MYWLSRFRGCGFRVWAFSVWGWSFRAASQESCSRDLGLKGSERSIVLGALRLSCSRGTLHVNGWSHVLGAVLPRVPYNSAAMALA